jgi:hypothetical protein
MKISKIIFQTSIFKPADYLVQLLKSKCVGWDYYHFNDEEILKYLLDNPIPEFPDAIKVFNSFEKGPHKSDFFRYYFLYLNGGVYIDSDAMLEKNIENIIENYYFFTVKSAINNNSMFNGFIGCEKNNSIVYTALKNLYNLDKISLQNDYFYICKDLYNVIDNYNRALDDVLVNSKEIIGLKNIIFNEELQENGICRTINNKNETLLLHYYGKTIIPADYEVPNKTLKQIKDMKIGITLNLPNDVKSMFSNGIRQNVLFLGELLCNIGYECYFILDDKNFNQDIIDKLLYCDNFKHVKYSKIYTIDFDLVISMGYELEVPVIKQLKYMKTKVISYLCGNSYFIDTEKILYNQHKARDSGKYLNKTEEPLFSQIWSIPQMVNTNKHYWQTLYRVKCIEVPFVWSENAIRLAILTENKTFEDLSYKNNTINNKKLAIFEPNISLMKWSFPALLVCENAYRLNNDNIQQVYVNNISDKKTGINDFNLDAFTKIVNNLDLCLDRKISIEGRYNTLAFMSDHASIAVSHQWENNLNYVYFDLAWMGWPIVHNAALCKDIGYYYPEFNYEEGGNKLIEALNHDSNLDNYIIKNRNAIRPFLTTSLELQNKYIKLISNLFVETTGTIHIQTNEYHTIEINPIVKSF